jgi:hypothetical protein
MVYITNYLININPNKVNQYIILKIRKMSLARFGESMVGLQVV